MFRVIRTTTLEALRADQTALGDIHSELEQAKTEAELANDAVTRAETNADDLLKQLGQALADRISAERARDAAIAQREQDKTETDRQLAQLRQDIATIRAAAADTENGETVRAALAYHVLRDMYADAWNQGLLPKRPFDLIAALLDFKTADQPAPIPTA